MGTITTIIILGVLLILSGFFSATETAFAGLNTIRLKQYSRSSKKKLSRKAKLVLKLQDNYAIFLSTVLVGNNIVNLTSASLATYLFTTSLGMGETGVLLATVIMTVLVIIFGEIIPKTLARLWSEKFAMFAARPISILVVIFKPVTVLFGKFDEKISDMVDEEERVTATEDELLDIVEKIEKEGVLEHQESELIQSAINFDSISVRNVMTPKEDVMYLHEDDDFDVVAKFFEENQFTRAPVYDEKNDLVVGIIHQRDVYSCYVDKVKKTAKELMTDAMYISHRRLLPCALEIIQRGKSHLLIVVDNLKEKHFLGVVTLEDVLEELVGEIYDEYDDSPLNVFEIGNHMYQVNGKVSLDDLFDNYLTETDFPRTKMKTVKDWVKELIVDVTTNVEVYYDNLFIKVLEISNKEIDLVEIEVLTDYDGE